MAGLLLTMCCIVDLLIAITIGVAYMDVQETSVYGQKDLEYFVSSFAGFCTNTAFFSVLSLVGSSSANYKFVATYKFASVFKFFATAGMMVAFAISDKICLQAKAVNWRWYEFEGRECDTVIMLLEVPLAVILFISLAAIAETSRQVSQIKGDQLYRSPILIGDLKPEGAHPSLSPRGREIQKWIDATEPMGGDLEAGRAGAHNPSTGFFYSGMGQ